MSQGRLKHSLSDARLVVIAGAGGVGKTTIAASAAVQAAVSGRRVAVLTIDPARRLAQALGFESFDDQIRHVDLGPEARGTLSALMLDVKGTGDAMVERFSASPERAQAILDNRYYRYFSTSLAGSQEYMAIEQVRRLLDDDEYDLVILDTPPATNALEFFDAPERLIQGLSRVPLQTIADGQDQGSLTGRLASRGRGLILRGLNRLTGGPFLEELAEFLGLFSGILDALIESSYRVQSLLRDARTQFYLVTTPTTARLEEVMSFRAELRRRDFPMGGVILNRVHRPLPMVSVNDELDGLFGGMSADERQQWSPELVLGCVDILRQHNLLAERDEAINHRLNEMTGEPPTQVANFPRGVDDLSGLSLIGRSLVTEGPL